MKSVMYKIVITIFALFQVLISVFGQNNSDFEEVVVDPYLDYYSLPQEQIYTHFNKSSYLPGDAIWFKCYAFNPKTKRPSVITKNLIVELYRPDGELVEQKILRVEQGVADNVFFLELDNPVGVYTFRAYTSWMKNFDDPSGYSVYLSVLGKPQHDSLPDNKIDVQFLPESGTLLEGLTNKVGIKAIDANGKGLRLSGEIIDENGVLIKTFELNKLGMGSVLLDITRNIKLNCRINLTGEQQLIYPLPLAEKQGIIAQVNQNNDKLFLRVATNRQTFVNDQFFYLMVHNKGLVQFIFSIELDPETKDKRIDLDKSEFMNGVNCLTIFNEEFEPVAERLFYVENSTIKGSLINDFSFGNDTLSIDLTSLNSDGKPVSANLSLSVLPGRSSANNFSNSLMSEVLLKPGLNGFIENPNFYFEYKDSVRLNDLDNLLITQGWRKYNWQHIKDSTSNTLVYEIENGFTLSGQVERWSKIRSKSDYQVFLHSSDKRVFKLSTVDSLGRFSFSNLSFFDSTQVYINVLNNKGKNTANKVNASVTPIYTCVSPIQKPKNILTNVKTNILMPTNFFSSDIMIEEVNVYDKKPSPPNASNIFNASESKTFTITDETVDKYRTIDDILRQEFGVSKVMMVHPVTKKPYLTYYMNRGLNSINLPYQVMLIIDDIPIGMNGLKNQWEDLSVYCSLSDIESISVNKTGFGLGGRGVDGAIIVKTRTTPVFSQLAQTIVNKLEVRGYSAPVTYYSPKYKVLPSDPDYLKYATIFWQPNVLTDLEGNTTVKFAIPSELNSFEIRIEGFADSGAIFLENKTISIK
jgi:hypothetical protein